jgi:hypothetical protein
MVRQLEEKSGEEMCLFKEEPTSQLASQPASQPTRQPASPAGRRADVQTYRSKLHSVTGMFWALKLHTASPWNIHVTLGNAVCAAKGFNTFIN